MPILRKSPMLLCLAAAVLLFAVPAQAEDNYEIFLTDGTSVKTSEYFEEGDKIVYDSFGAPVEVEKSRVREVKSLIEFQNAETVEYEGDKKAPAGARGKNTAQQKTTQTPRVKTTPEQRMKWRDEIKQNEEYLAKIKKCGASCFQAEACMAVGSGKGWVTAQQLFEARVRETEGHIRVLKRRLNGEIVMEPRRDR
ncbi:MAG: hypothetical protein AB1921_12130 [Thermodesulfobacteriota bacterium]